MNKENLKQIGDKVLSDTLKATKAVANLGVDITKAHINAKNEEAKAIALQNQVIQQRELQEQLAHEIGQLLSYGSGNYSSLNVNAQGIMNLISNSAYGNLYKFGLMKSNINQNLTPFQERHLLNILQKDLSKFGIMELKKYGANFPIIYPLLSKRFAKILTVKDTGVEFCLVIELT